MQDETDMVITDGKQNDTCTRHLPDPIYKNAIQKQNPFEIDFKDNSKFDEQNPIFDSQVSEMESGKLPEKSVKTLLNKAQNRKDIESKVV